MQWLIANWNHFETAARASKHDVSDEMLAAIYNVLNPQPTVVIEATTSTQESEVIEDIAEVITLQEVTYTEEELAELEEIERLETEMALLESLDEALEEVEVAPAIP